MRNETFGYHCPRTWVLTNILWQFLFEGSVRRKPVSVQKYYQEHSPLTPFVEKPPLSPALISGKPTLYTSALQHSDLTDSVNQLQYKLSILFIDKYSLCLS